MNRLRTTLAIGSALSVVAMQGCGTLRLPGFTGRPSSLVTPPPPGVAGGVAGSALTGAAASPASTSGMASSADDLEALFSKPYYVQELGQDPPFSVFALSDSLDLSQVSLASPSAIPGQEVIIGGVPTRAGKVRVKMTVDGQTALGFIRQVDDTHIALVTPVLPSGPDSAEDVQLVVSVRGKDAPPLILHVKPLPPAGDVANQIVDSEVAAMQKLHLGPIGDALADVLAGPDNPNSVEAMLSQMPAGYTMGQVDRDTLNRVMASTGFQGAMQNAIDQVTSPSVANLFTITATDSASTAMTTQSLYSVQDQPWATMHIPAAQLDALLDQQEGAASTEDNAGIKGFEAAAGTVDTFLAWNKELPPLVTLIPAIGLGEFSLGVNLQRVLLPDNPVGLTFSADNVLNLTTESVGGWRNAVASFDSSTAPVDYLDALSLLFAGKGVANLHGVVKGFDAVGNVGRGVNYPYLFNIVKARIVADLPKKVAVTLNYAGSAIQLVSDLSALPTGWTLIPPLAPAPRPLRIRRDGLGQVLRGRGSCDSGCCRGIRRPCL